MVKNDEVREVDIEINPILDNITSTDELEFYTPPLLEIIGYKKRSLKYLDDLYPYGLDIPIKFPFKEK